MKELRNGLLTGLTLQLAIGPIFFIIMNLTLQRSIWDGFAGVAAATLVDYFYISLAVFGIGRLLEDRRVKKLFGIVSSAVLIVFGLVVLKSISAGDVFAAPVNAAAGVLASFSLVLLLTLSSPLTIVFFTSLFTARVIEYGYTRNRLLLFGLGTGLATFLFMSAAVILFSLVKATVPWTLIMLLNALVGCLLIGYGAMRLWKTVRTPHWEDTRAETSAG